MVRGDEVGKSLAVLLKFVDKSSLEMMINHRRCYRKHERVNYLYNTITTTDGAMMIQWLSCWILHPVFPGSKPGGGKADSAFHPSKVGKMSSSVINATKCVVVRVVRALSGELLRQKFECTQPR